MPNEKDRKGVLISIVILFLFLVFLCLMYLLSDQSIKTILKTSTPGAFISELTMDNLFPTSKVHIIRIVCALVVTVPFYMLITWFFRHFGHGHVGPPSAVARETIGRLLYLAAAAGRKRFVGHQPLDIPRIDSDMPICDLQYRAISADELRSQNYILGPVDI